MIGDNKIEVFASFVIWPEVCTMNSADWQSLQFIMNEILFKIFGAMSKDTYSEVSKYVGIEPLEQVIGVRRDKFLMKYCATYAA